MQFKHKIIFFIALFSVILFVSSCVPETGDPCSGFKTQESCKDLDQDVKCKWINDQCLRVSDKCESCQNLKTESECLYSDECNLICDWKNNECIEKEIPRDIDPLLACKQDSDCILAPRDVSCSMCSPCRIDVSDYIAVNNSKYNDYKYKQWEQICPTFFNCYNKGFPEECQNFLICPSCATIKDNDVYDAKCINNVCTKLEKEQVAIDEGAYGIIQYGEGDCMPPVVEERRRYTNFNGDVYFVREDEFLNGIIETDEAFVSKGFKTSVKNGEYRIKLETGDYRPILKGVSQSNQKILIQDNKFIKKDFKFFKCLTQ